jgi:hypothetical protein
MDELKRKARDMFEGKMRDVDDIVEMVVEEVNSRSCTSCKDYSDCEIKRIAILEYGSKEESFYCSGWEFDNA